MKTEINKRGVMEISDITTPTVLSGRDGQKWLALEDNFGALNIVKMVGLPCLGKKRKK